MLMGFGCSVPAIMGARTMENEKDRRMTILLVPFMSCSAKLPVYGMIAGAFFGPWAGLVVFGLYVLGMLAGILSGLLFKRTLFAGDPAPFVLELPPYRLPSFENIATHVWQKVKGCLLYTSPPVPVRHAGHVHHHLRSLRLLAAKRRQRPDRPVFQMCIRDRTGSTVFPRLSVKVQVP